MITQQELKELLDYNKDTGIFTWKQSRGGLARKGSRAGSIESKGYYQITLKQKLYMAHRLAWLYVHGSFPDNFIDHINGIRTDNRIENLRDVTKGQNQRNQKKYTTNKSGIVGVSWHKQHQKWYANIQVNKKTMFLGLFKDIKDAENAVSIARQKYDFHENHGRE